MLERPFVFEIAFIQEQGNGRLTHESRLVRDHCVRIGMPVELYTSKRINRRQLPLDRQSFIFGDIDSMRGAMKQLNIPVPEAAYYPSSLTDYLHRKVWLDTLGNVRKRIEDGGAAVFAKPASRVKIFTGQVFSHHGDFYFVGQTSRNEPVWCSEVVSWRSEYRVYVIGTEIVSVDHYDGDTNAGLDLNTVSQAIAEYARSGDAPTAYGIDFGILTSGETALVEANDGYALGAYQIGSAAYSELVFARWQELLASSTAE